MKLTPDSGCISLMVLFLTTSSVYIPFPMTDIRLTAQRGNKNEVTTCSEQKEKEIGISLEVSWLREKHFTESDAN